jgi:hypothetical protein
MEHRGCCNVLFRWGGEKSSDDIGYLFRKIRWYRIANLSVLMFLWAFEEIIVWKSLQSSSFAYSQAAALAWVRVNVVMPILCNMGHYGRGRYSPTLDSEPIVKGNLFRVDVFVFRP